MMVYVMLVDDKRGGKDVTVYGSSFRARADARDFVESMGGSVTRDEETPKESLVFFGYYDGDESTVAVYLTEVK